LKGKGDGSFRGPCAYAVGPSPRAFTSGDFVVDDVRDLAVIGYSGDVSVLPGQANGSFGAPIVTSTGLSGGSLLVSSDLDGNELEDLLLADGNFSSSSLSLLSSAGNGMFDPPQTFPAGGRGTRSIAIGDVNGDLVNDLVLSNSSSNQLSVHLGRSIGGFEDPLRFGTGRSPAEVELSDLDRDGDLDAVVSNREEDTMSVLLGLGDGFFAPDVPYLACDGPSSFELGDFDGDGLTDLIVSCVGDFSDRGSLSILHGLGDGTLGPPALVPGRNELLFDLHVADLNGDGVPDLSGTSFSRILVFLGSGPETFADPDVFTTSGFIGSLDLHDLNGDDKPDLVTVDGSGGQALVFLNQAP